jgi:hypothetical protein
MDEIERAKAHKHLRVLIDQCEPEVQRALIVLNHLMLDQQRQIDEMNAGEEDE